MSNQAELYEKMILDASFRNTLNTTEKCEQVLKEMSTFIPPADLPPCYNWLKIKAEELANQQVAN